MTRPPRPIVLNAFFAGAGHHPAASRVTGVEPAQITASWYQDLARTAERAKLHSIFFADGPAHHPAAGRGTGAARNGVPEPRILLTTIAAATSNIGLIATSSTTYNHPYTLAREFASLDTVSEGRAGWNVVTTSSDAAAANYGGEQLTHAARYSRADEFLQVALGLWAGWDEDPSQEGGIRPLDHVGEHFSVAGPLTLGRSPQGHPVIVQAGSSDAGIALAAKYAEAVFTATPTLEQGREYYAKLKAAVVEAGRDPEHVKVLPGLMPFVAETEEEARALKATYDDAIDFTGALEGLGLFFGGVDLTGYDLDAPVPFDELPTGAETEGHKSRVDLLRRIASEQNLTLRGLLQVLANGRGHLNFVGSYVQVADLIEEWTTTGAADGFNLLIPAYPVLLEDFAEHVLPILLERGLFHTEYAGTTLRANYGLPVPTSEETLKELARLG